MGSGTRIRYTLKYLVTFLLHLHYLILEARKYKPTNIFHCLFTSSYGVVDVPIYNRTRLEAHKQDMYRSHLKCTWSRNNNLYCVSVSRRPETYARHLYLGQPSVGSMKVDKNQELIFWQWSNQKGPSVINHSEPIL